MTDDPLDELADKYKEAVKKDAPAVLPIVKRIHYSKGQYIVKVPGRLLEAILPNKKEKGFLVFTLIVKDVDGKVQNTLEVKHTEHEPKQKKE